MNTNRREIHTHYLDNLINKKKYCGYTINDAQKMAK